MRSSRRSTSILPLILLASAGLSAISFVALPAPARSVQQGPRSLQRTRLHAKDSEVIDVEVVELTKLEEDIEAQIQKAEEEDKPTRVRDLARLLVLTRASAASAAWQKTKELREAVSTSVANSLREYVGKEDYDINDVTAKVQEEVSDAVSGLENVYLTKEAAEAAPEGTEPIIIGEVVGPVVGQVKEGTKEAVLAFTGKEEYKFGDISKEAAARAKTAMANLMGSEEYQFGDVTKAAMNKAYDAVTSFTGKEDYKFGDVTKTILRGALNWLEKDDKKEGEKK